VDFHERPDPLDFRTCAFYDSSKSGASAGAVPPDLILETVVRAENLCGQRATADQVWDLHHPGEWTVHRVAKCKGIPIWQSESRFLAPLLHSFSIGAEPDCARVLLRAWRIAVRACSNC